MGRVGSFPGIEPTSPDPSFSDLANLFLNLDDLGRYVDFVVSEMTRQVPYEIPVFCSQNAVR
jgi:hypothetical protein